MPPKDFLPDDLLRSAPAAAPSRLRIVGGRVLRRDGTLGVADIDLAGGCIAAPAGSPDATVRADGLLVLPGIVDIHGDAFERQMMPRPGVHMPVAIALAETDRQMAANGITTAFHGVTWSWEPGLRGRDSFLAVAAALDAQRGRQGLAVDTRLHLRFETYNIEAVDEAAEWLAAGRIDLLAFNDHTPDICASLGNPTKVQKIADRTGLSAEAVGTLAREVLERRHAVADAVERLAAAARTAGVPMLSHDDDTPDLRAFYRALGCRVSEFPKNFPTARAARDAGDAVVAGAPNVLRGGSHNGGVAAADLVRAGIASVLASDYFYPAPLLAAFRLMREAAMPLGGAWALVSSGPAAAAGLTDRGAIEPGLRGDVIVVDASDPDLPRVAAAFSAGRLIHAARYP